MTIKEQLIREIEQTPEALLIQFMQVWRSTKQTSIGLTHFDETSSVQSRVFNEKSRLFASIA